MFYVSFSFFLSWFWFFYHLAQRGRFGFGLVWSIGFISFLVCKENGIKAANMEFFLVIAYTKRGIDLDL